MLISKTAHLKRLLQALDTMIGTLAYSVTVDFFWLAGWLGFDQVRSHLLLTPLVIICCIFASAAGKPRLHGESVTRLLLFSLRFTLMVLAGMLTLIYFSQLGSVDLTVVSGFAGLLFFGLLSNRLILRWWYFHNRREHPSNYLKVLVIGSGNRAQKLMEQYRTESDWGIDIIGILDPDPALAGTLVNDTPVLGDARAIRKLLANEVVDEVIICLPRSLIDGIDEIVEACEEEAVCIKLLADICELPKGSLTLETVGNLPLLSVAPVAHDEWKLVIKRIFDLFIAIPAVVLLLPIFAIVALAIKLNSPGPVFFSQPRVGLNKRIFKMIKFRSMYVDAEKRLAEIEHLNEADGPIFKMASDPRITRVGRFIRRSSIDELPQLLNVLLGHMSLVGPRPMSLRDVNLFSRGIQRKRFSVRPGLACLREVSGRSKLTFEKWLELDLKYIDEWSLWLDLKILLKILPSVIKGEGAS